MGQWDAGGYSPFLWEPGMAVQRHPPEAVLEGLTPLGRRC